MLKQRLIFLEELSADVAAQHIVLAPRALVVHLLSDVVPLVVDDLLPVEQLLIQLLLYHLIALVRLYFLFHVDDPLSTDHPSFY